MSNAVLPGKLHQIKLSVVIPYLASPLLMLISFLKYTGAEDEHGMRFMNSNIESLGVVTNARVVELPGRMSRCFPSSLDNVDLSQKGITTREATEVSSVVHRRKL